MPPPVRTTAADYHYHVYDYDKSEAWKLSPAQTDRNKYQFYSMVEDLMGLSETGLARNVPNTKLFIAPKATVRGRRMLALSFGNDGAPDDRPTVLITGGIHAREWAATEMAYLLAEYLIINYDQEADHGEALAIKNLIDSRNICIIPMLNPDGNWYTVFGGGAADGPARLWRKNRRLLPTTSQGWVTELTSFGNPNPPFQNVQKPLFGRADYRVPTYVPEDGIPPKKADFQKRDLDNGQIGVDLNRNMATQAFGYDSPPRFVNYNPTSESYFGPKAGAETETANLQQYVADLGDLAASIDYHAFGQLILYSGEAGNRNRVGIDYIALGKALEVLVKTPKNKYYRLGTPLERVTYEATGSVADYMAQYNQSRAFTIEVDPTNDPMPDPIQEGFLLAETDILPMFQTNIRGALAALAAPLPAAEKTDRLARRQAINLSQSTYLAWDVYDRGNQLPGED